MCTFFPVYVHLYSVVQVLSQLYIHLYSYYNFMTYFPSSFPLAVFHIPLPRDQQTLSLLSNWKGPLTPAVSCQPGCCWVVGFLFLFFFYEVFHFLFLWDVLVLPLYASWLKCVLLIYNIYIYNYFLTIIYTLLCWKPFWVILTHCWLTM